ncbi:MAG: SAM-dependent methyltransferase [bacterium]
MSDSRWESFARKAPLWYTCTDFRGDENEYWDSGKKQAERIVSAVKHRSGDADTVVEIGCGLGRILIPMSSYFSKCIGVDISETMLELLNKFAGEKGVRDKIETCLPDRRWYEHKSDFIYSFQVFQHVEDFEVISDYLEKISESLVSGGSAYLQFDTRPQTPIYRTKNKLPDFSLPKQWRKGIKSIRRKSDDIVLLLERYGLSIVKQKNAYTNNHIFILKKH